jgi:nicotinamidase-related amidase
MPHTSPSGTAAGATALLVIDMISGWDFPDAGQLLPRALAITPRIAALKTRCRRAGVPTIYANDNHGRWRSDFRRVAQESLEGPGAKVTQLLSPEEDDYFVLKPRHSAFFATPLDLLLRHLKVNRLLLVGVAGDQCVMSTATDAHMHGLEVHVPQDCVASMTKGRDHRLLLHLQDVLGVRTTVSNRMRVLPPTRGAVGRREVAL